MRWASQRALVVEAAKAEPRYPIRSIRQKIYGDSIEPVCADVPHRTQPERTRVRGFAKHSHHLGKRHALLKRREFREENALVAVHLCDRGRT